MKKITTIAVLAFMTLNINAQTSFIEAKFFNESQLIGLKIVPNRYDATIYKNIKNLCNKSKDNILYLKNGYICSDIEQYKNDTFLILDTINSNSYLYENSNVYTEYCMNSNYLKAVNLQKLDTCFIKYESKYFYNQFYTEIDRNKLFLNKKCDFSRVVDDFTNDISINMYDVYTNMLDKESSISISKHISKKTGSFYYISLNVIGYSAEVFYENKTIQILFDDNTKIIKNAKIETDIDSDANFRYSSYIALTKQELAIFQKKLVKKIRLDYFDGEINYLEALNFQYNSKCIETIK